MSPERTDGARVSAASDIFSLGLIVCELACGHHPFAETEALKVLNRIRTIDPRQVAEPVGPRLRPLVEQMLVRDPRERTITMGKVEQTLASRGTRLMRLDRGTLPSNRSQRRP